jgi:UDP-N-acetylmuramoyl-tripeptide--D-alanyl-D-alanine ligase
MEIEKIYETFKANPIVSTDTRKIEKGCIYFSLKGENFNGNKFAKDAIKKGARYAIIDEKEYHISDRFILVDNVLTTLQQLANFHRKQFNIPIIGITGTNGKTTTKELINSVLSTGYLTTATKGNLNNHIGVPLTLLSMSIDCELAIIEMGASHVGEIDFLCRIAEPNFGIITNIGTAHIEGFGSPEGVIKAKSELYQYIQSVNGTIFVNNNDEKLSRLSINNNLYTYGYTKSDCNATLITSTPYVKLKWKKETIKSNLYGSYNFENITAAICIGNYFKIPSDKIKKALENYYSTNNRSQIMKIESNTIFLDAYNANPTSMNAAIETFAENNSENKLMILGDMLELGNISQKEHQKIIDKVYSLNIQTLFIGNEFNTVSNKHDFVYLKDYNKVIDWLKHAGIYKSQILIKGSRGIRLEKVAEYLKKKDA